MEWGLTEPVVYAHGLKLALPARRAMSWQGFAQLEPYLPAESFWQSTGIKVQSKCVWVYVCICILDTCSNMYIYMCVCVSVIAISRRLHSQCSHQDISLLLVLPLVLFLPSPRHNSTVPPPVSTVLRNQQSQNPLFPEAKTAAIRKAFYSCMLFCLPIPTTTKI